ncbi:multidrug resistance protein [Bdellovibrio bacteriovorus]|uniref:Multidrug resistance protein n=1 Tax=Bdellovibrio bacteriovorus TaxID=959 RepID=A0A150WJ16_BDEBC|nr:MFS transporter [Bdellovibrio bacteriovorus]KYG63758.1 multidrug resistance protein [Bdellovibrio bacteriovorus]
MKTLRAIGHLNTATFSALQMMLFTLIPFISEKTQLSMTSIVASFSVGSFLFLWSSPFWSSRSDSWGRMKVLCLGMAGLTVSTALLVLLLMVPELSDQSSLILWASRILYGLTAAGIVPVAQALQIDLNPKKSPMKAMLSNSMSLNIGRALGPLYLLIGGGQNMLPVLQGAVVWSMVLFLANVTLIGKSLQQTQKAETVSLASWFGTFSKMRAVFSLALLFTIFIGILNFSLAAILKKSFALTGADSSVLMAQVLLVSAILAVLTQGLGKVFFKNPWQGSFILGSLGLLGGSLLLGEMSSQGELWGAIAMLSLGIALIPPSYLSLMASGHKDTNLGRRTGLVGAANTLGYSLGGAFAAITFQINRFEVEHLLVAFVVVIGFNIAILYRGRGDQNEVLYAQV